MDRLREANRRGSLSGGAQISSLRRPRSGGFKDSTAGDEDESMEDFHSARLRERPRKEGSVLSASRHKRTRHASRELHSRIGVVEDAQGSEIGASDEDDDVPISPNLLPRKPTKLRFHGKVTSEEGNVVEIPAVPRKARTAISKRPHESLQGDGTRQHSHAYASQSSTLAAPLFTPPGPALKPMKRMKHNGPKVKAAKHSKVSASVSISEQEVEVAEALFDLARMVSNMGSPLCDDDTKEVKMENGELKGTAWLTSPESTPIRRQDSISTPPSSHSAVSSPVRGATPVTSLYMPASEAPTRKISLSKLKIEDGTHSQLKNDLTGLVNGVVDKNMSMKDDGRTGQGPHYNAAAPKSPLLVPNQFSQTSNINIPVTDDKTSLYPKIPFDSALGSCAPSKSETSFLTAFLDQKQESGKEHKTADACDVAALSKEKKLKTSYPCKYEIDLMASPNGSATGVTIKNGNDLDLTGLGPNKLLQEQDKDLYPNNEKHEGQPPVDACVVKEEGVSSGNEKEARKSVKLNEDAKEENSRENERDQQVVKREFLDTVKNIKPDLMKQHTSDGSGWPGSFPHMGYYPSAAAAAAAAAAVAAAWPATGSVIGALSMEEKCHPGLQVPPFAFPGARPLCKRCATHVYIAHFIDTQQQMQRHPIWAAGGLYSMKPYNVNAPLPPNALFGGGLSGLTGLSVNNSPAIKGFNPESSPQNDKGSAPGAKEKSTSLTMDGVDRKGASQSLQAANMDQVTPLQAGLGPMFGYPVSADTEGNNVLNKGSSAGGATAAVASHLESVGASTSPNTDSVNVAAAQVQYLQAIIQQAGFPFSFSPGHLMPPTMPPTTGHMAQQQATQFYGNPFYNAPFVQQGSATGRVTPKMNSPQGQSSTSMHQDARVSHSVSQQHQQQQQQLSSASSSQSHQRIASQHLQHFGDLGGEAVSSAESKFPGYQKNMQSHEASIMHASNMSSSSSLHSAGMPAHVSLAAKQVVNMKLPLPQSCGQGQVQQHSQNMIPQYHSMGVKNMDFQSPQGSSSMPSGVVSKNMIGPGPLGLASVAAVMASQGHTVLQTMPDTQLPHHAYQDQSLQQTYNKFTTNANLEGSKTSAEMSGEKRTPVKQASASCTSKMDIESESSSRGSISGLTSAHMQQNFPNVSFNFMTSPVGNLGSRQGVPAVSVAPVSMPSSRPVAVGRANTTLSNMAATAHESTALNKSASSNVPFHVPSLSGHHGIRQGQAANQYSSQTKPVSRTQVGTTCVSTAPSPLLPGSYAGVSNTKQLGYSAKNQQASISSQSRFPPTMSGSSSAPASPSTSISKSNSNATVKTTPPGKGSLNSAQKQALSASGKKPDALTHSPGQVVGPNSMTVSMGQQQQQSQHQQIQNAIKQQQQWQQQQKHHHNLHQEHSQQGPQSMHHQVHVAGVPPTVTVQYHQASGTHQVGQAGVQKQSAQPQQMKQRLYSEQHFYQQQLQQQSQLTEAQSSARPSTQQHSAQRPVVSAANRPMQQPPELHHQQANKHQAVFSHQQPFSLASFGTSSSGVVPHTSLSISTGNGSVGRLASSDGALMQVLSPKANTSMKPPGGTGASVPGSNIQRSSTPNSGISHVQGMGAKLTDAKSQPQSSSNISYLPYLHSATYSSAAAPVVKGHGGSFMHSQSGATVKSTREPSAGSGREDNNTVHQFKDRACPASIAPLTSANSHSCTVSAATNVKSSISQLNTDVKAASRTTPLVLHGLSDSHVATASGQPSQTCTVTSASMTADSVSTTG